MVTTFTSWRFGMQDRLIRAGVQLTPLPLRLMIVQLASCTAFRACPIHHVVNNVENGPTLPQNVRRMPDARFDETRSASDPSLAENGVRIARSPSLRPASHPLRSMRFPGSSCGIRVPNLKRFRSAEREKRFAAVSRHSHLKMTRGHRQKRAGALAVTSPDPFKQRRVWPIVKPFLPGASLEHAVRATDQEKLKHLCITTRDPVRASGVLPQNLGYGMRC